MHGQIHVAPAIAGGTLILIGVFLAYTGGAPTILKKRELDYLKGVEFKAHNLTVSIVIEEIQNIATVNQDAAIVLPTNTAFVDDCAADSRTAIGAFFMSRFPSGIASLPALLLDLLAEQGQHPDANNQFAAGTTVVLPDEFARPAKVVITASTIRGPGVGITSSPQVICSCVECILRETADHCLDTIYLPLLGSGHGGVEKGAALLILALCLLHFAKSYHHIRSVYIVVHPRDADVLRKSPILNQFFVS